MSRPRNPRGSSLPRRAAGSAVVPGGGPSPPRRNVIDHEPEKRGTPTLTWPTRDGARPRITPTNPHQQLEQNAPERWQRGMIARVRMLPGVTLGESRISGGSTAFLLEPAMSGRNPAAFFDRVAEFVHVRPARASPAGGRSYASGSCVAAVAQPAGRLLRTMMDAETPLDLVFAREDEARVARRQEWELYDVTAWSLPLMFNVRADTCRAGPSVAGDRVGPDDAPAGGAIGASTVSHVVSWSGTSAAARSARLG